MFPAPSHFQADNVGMSLCFLLPAVAFLFYLRQFERVMAQEVGNSNMTDTPYLSIGSGPIRCCACDARLQLVCFRLLCTALHGLSLWCGDLDSSNTSFLLFVLFLFFFSLWTKKRESKKDSLLIVFSCNCQLELGARW